ncbi:MAG: 3-carboxy-cis,cis-muconate cycloisomerase [Alphaproteobacteria bacterium]|jgi:3-carboxy-cis,cis-muconate cycloisomerase
MTSDPFTSALNGDLFSTPEMRALFDDGARVAAMVRVEVALAAAEAKAGVIPVEAADAIATAAAGFEPDLAAIGAGSETAGVPVPALVAQLRSAVGGDAAQWVHWGATSQDIVDTALVLLLRAAVAVMDARLAGLTERLAELARAHRDTAMLARTRLQQAAPTSFGLKLAGWRAPLVDHRARLAELEPRLLQVQFGGAAGTLAPLGDQGIAVLDALAADLDLAAPALPWHTRRDGLAEFAGWLSLVTGSLGKVGLDIGLMSQSEVGELRESGDAARGGSSTLPQKANPVGSEVLVALARHNANALAAMHQVLVAEHERSGMAWSLEWLTLPGMVMAADATLAHAQRIVAELVVDADRMAANIEVSAGLVLAEAASFALAAHLPRVEAQALVKDAAAVAMAEGRHLVDVLAERCDAPVDWAALRDPAGWLGVAGAFIDRALTED